MADYAGQANSIYDPQMQADKAQAAAGYTSNLAGFTGEQTAADTAYNNALGDNTKAVAHQNDVSNFTASTHGLWSSGLAANMIRLNEQGGANNAARIAQGRAAKLSDIASRRQGVTLKYNADMGALSSKYQGDKANYVATHQNEDAKMAAQEAAATARANASAARRSANVDPAKGYGMTSNNINDNAHGMSFHGNHGEPISAGAYLDGISNGNAGTKDLAKLLSGSDSASDKKIASPTINGKNNPDYIGNMSLEQAQKTYPWLFQ